MQKGNGGLKMNEVILFVISALKITLIDIIMSGDNVGVIALAIRNLDPKQAKLAGKLGVAGAVGLRILFTCMVTLILRINTIPFHLIGGILLVKITWDLMKQGSEEEHENIKPSGNLVKAVMSIIIADVSMSLDNVLAVASAADGSVGLMIFGILLSIPIIFFGSQYVAKLMQRYKIVIYIGGAILIHTAMAMIFEDNLIHKYINEIFANIFPWIIASVVLVYGFIKTKNVRA
jgi:YjbE family integral membrane protein